MASLIDVRCNRALNCDRVSWPCAAQLLGADEQIGEVAGLAAGKRSPCDRDACFTQAHRRGLVVNGVEARTQHVDVADEGSDEPIARLAVNIGRPGKLPVLAIE